MYSDISVDVYELIRPFLEEDLTGQEIYWLRISPSLSGVREKLLTQKFTLRDMPSTQRMLRNIIRTATRFQITAASGIILDGPMGPGKGQGNTEIIYALDGSKVLCAKVGPPFLQHEFDVSSAIHRRSVCPSVLHIEQLIPLPSAETPQVVLLMPAYAMSVADAALAFPPGTTVERDIFAFNVAISGLAGIYACALAGFAHGDIKPSNFMLSMKPLNAPPPPMTLIDFGTAKPFGELFTEASIFNLNEKLVASVDYDLVCLGATIATLQDPTACPDDDATRASFVAQLARAVDEEAVQARSPGTTAAALCLQARVRGIPDLQLLENIANLIDDARHTLAQTIPRWQRALTKDAVWPQPHTD